MASELKKCCDKSKIIRDTGVSGWMIFCRNCHRAVVGYKSLESAEKAWNRRADENSKGY